jgi:hypothetical protein
MAMNRRRVPRTLTLPAELVSQIEALAARESRPLSREVERAIKGHLALSAMDN